ncbi:hypothetical protein CCAX7_49680 [Capsulimonas corticalis]|uniref:Uncharacterized protein n=1 Tax=Capsulimonas corticalis TaxID=2219043 RepID=A0A402CPU6_9BACT|nr:GntR family transcriptional regulator [Capsulimonas corticalis]BDI32917.1 hypothetical protein CCAX7_49680 [Capsulimonas corticalis]
MGRHKSDVEIRLREYLRRPERRVGDKLPGERALAAALGVGRTALRPALEALEAEGVIRRQPRSGAFLASVPAPAGRGALLAVVAPLQGMGEERPAGDPSWIHRVISAFERTANVAGASVTLYDQSPLAADPCSVKDLVRRAAEDGADAVIVFHALGERGKIAHALAILHDLGVPSVVISSRTYPGLASQVYFDSGWGSYLAVRHLLSYGHTRIGFAGGASGHEWVQDRRRGYQAALEASDIAPEPLWEFLPSDGEAEAFADDGAFAVRQWLALPAAERPTAIVAANDQIALSVLTEAASHGLSAPADFSLIGFDNGAEALRIGLTTVERPTEALGEAIARVTLERLAAGPSADSVTVRLRPVLIQRKTVGSPASSVKNK